MPCGGRKLGRIVSWSYVGSRAGSDKHDHISKEIFKKSVAGAAWFFLLTVIAGGNRLIERRTYNLKKKPESHVSKNSELLQMAKM